MTCFNTFSWNNGYGCSCILASPTKHWTNRATTTIKIKIANSVITAGCYHWLFVIECANGPTGFWGNLPISLALLCKNNRWILSSTICPVALCQSKFKIITWHTHRWCVHLQSTICWCAFCEWTVMRRLGSYGHWWQFFCSFCRPIDGVTQQLGVKWRRQSIHVFFPAKTGQCTLKQTEQ